MLGAIIGDISGSKYEFNSCRNPNFEIIDKDCFFTDDTVLTFAVAEALMKGKRDPEKTKNHLIKSMRKMGKLFPNCGYGGRFSAWLKNPEPKPYNSYGNGSAMRVSPVAWFFHSLNQVEYFAGLTAEVTHNHPEGIKGAQATAAAIFLARIGRDKQYIKRYIELKYHYDFSKSLDEIKKGFHFDETCQGTVPVALEIFFESVDFEDVIKKSVLLGGDCDTIAAIACSVAEGYYPIPSDIEAKAMEKLDRRLKTILNNWNNDLSVSKSKYQKCDLLRYTDYFLSNPVTVRKEIKDPNSERTAIIPEYSETMHNFIFEASNSEYFRDDFKEILAKHDIKRYEDMIVELPDANKNLLSSFLTLILLGEKSNPGNIAWAAENGIIGDILNGLVEVRELEEKN